MSTILLIDDSEAERALTRKMLEEEGHTVHESGDGAAGVRLFRELKPDLVICDLLMPGKSGFEAVQEIRTLVPQAPIIAISGVLFGLADHETMRQNFGFAAVIEKPFRRAQLIETVRRALF
jgi:CheY-like chemotaxis protein